MAKRAGVLAGLACAAASVMGAGCERVVTPTGKANACVTDILNSNHPNVAQLISTKCSDLIQAACQSDNVSHRLHQTCSDSSLYLNCTREFKCKRAVTEILASCEDPVE